MPTTLHFRHDDTARTGVGAVTYSTDNPRIAVAATLRFLTENHIDPADVLVETPSLTVSEVEAWRSERHLRCCDAERENADTVSVTLRLTPSEAATLHHFIGTHAPALRWTLTRDGLLDIRKRLLHALKDSGVLS